MADVSESYTLPSEDLAFRSLMKFKDLRKAMTKHQQKYIYQICWCICLQYAKKVEIHV